MMTSNARLLKHYAYRGRKILVGLAIVLIAGTFLVDAMLRTYQQ